MNKQIPVEISNCNLKLTLSVKTDELETDIKDQLALIEEIKQNFDIEKLEKLALMIAGRIESVEISGGSLGMVGHPVAVPQQSQQVQPPQPMQAPVVEQDLRVQVTDPNSYMLKYHPLRGKTCPEMDKGILEYYLASGVLGPEDREVVQNFLQRGNSMRLEDTTHLDDDDIPF